MIIKIEIKNKIARVLDLNSLIVCGNDDYKIEFAFDEEWAEYEEKTAYFVANGKTLPPVVFQGNKCDVPKLSNTTALSVGVSAGDLKTTTDAVINCRKSIRCKCGDPVEPTPVVYDQIMQMINDGKIKGEKGDLDDNALDLIKEWIKEATNYDGTVGLHYVASRDSNFAGCAKVGRATDTDIKIGSTYLFIPVKYIGVGAFRDCFNLTSVVIPNSVEDISQYAFYGCSGLTSVVIPNSVIWIGRYTFANCCLKRVDFSTHTSIPAIGEHIFGEPLNYDFDEDLQIKVPANLIDEAKSATNWSEYADYIVTEFTN